jgi:predicted AlkP superfamily pyrophosphatase or phosphodiesterase
MENKLTFQTSVSMKYFMQKTLIVLTLLVVSVLPLTAKHYTVVLSLDGFRWDYPEWYKTPFLDSLAAHGVKSGLIPSFPSKTFPNHYTMATGCYPDHHGIVANSFFDPTTGKKFSLADKQTKTDPHFYGGEPIWITAKKRGLRTAVFYWPGSDVKVGGLFPDTYYIYDQTPRLTFEERARKILDQLRLPENQRPDLIMGYFEQPDANGHFFGPQDKRTQRAVMQMDSILAAVYRGIRTLPVADSVNFIIVSDHGMTTVNKSRQVNILPLLSSRWIKAIEGSVPANIYIRQGCVDSVLTALKSVDHVRVWRRQDIPSYLHYGSNERVGDVVVCPDLGYVVTDMEVAPGGNHGYDPTMMDMHAVFRAVGPDFLKVEWSHFPNVDLYPLLCQLLRITPASCDGKLDDVIGILGE